MTFGHRRSRELPKNFDLHVYNEMHSWLRHKPTINPPHFRDLMKPADGNFNPQRGLDDFPNGGEDSRGDAPLHVYIEAAAVDAAVDSFSDCDPFLVEVDGSASINKTIPTFPSPPPNTSLAVDFRPWYGTPGGPPFMRPQQE
jgi:hypothetical protein